MDIRLNKYICDSGYCSRRQADKFIESGNVKVDGKVAKVGAVISSKSVVMVNGNTLEPREEDVYIILNKPTGVTCTTDTSDPTNIVDFVNYPTRIFNIGRLDKDSEGLIMLTNNGDIVNKILRAGNDHDKEYEVTVDRSIDDTFIKRMSSGIPILGTVTKKCKVIKEGDKSFRIILTQGLNRQIRRMCEFLGYNVVKLRRVRMMNIKLDKLALGNWRELNSSETNELLSLISKSDNSEAASKGAGAGKATPRSFSGQKSRAEKTARGDRFERGNKPGRSDRPAKSERPGRSEKSARNDKPTSSGRSSNSGRPSNSARQSTNGRPSSSTRASSKGKSTSVSKSNTRQKVRSKGRS